MLKWWNVWKRLWMLCVCSQGVSRWFNKVLDVSSGDIHSSGVKPITFIRQVMMISSAFNRFITITSTTFMLAHFTFSCLLVILWTKSLFDLEKCSSRDEDVLDDEFIWSVFVFVRWSLDVCIPVFWTVMTFLLMFRWDHERCSVSVMETASVRFSVFEITCIIKITLLTGFFKIWWIVDGLSMVTGSYTDSSGLAYVRNNVAKFISLRDGSASSRPEHIFITCGSQRGLTVRFRIISSSSLLELYSKRLMSSSDRDEITVSIRRPDCRHDPRARPSHPHPHPGEGGLSAAALSPARTGWVEPGEGGAQESHPDLQKEVLSTSHLHQ